MGSERRPRKMEGRTYHYVDAYDKRADAASVAKYLRGGGSSVRIIPETYSFATNPHRRPVFSVWVNYKGSKK